MLQSTLGSKYLFVLALASILIVAILLVRYLKQRGKAPHRDLATRVKEREEGE